MADPTTPSESAKPVPVQSLERGLDILEQFTADSRTLSLSELSRRTGLHRATVYRFVKTLEGQGYLITDGSGSYSIGPSWAMALFALGSGTVFADMLNTDLQALAEATQETAALGVRRGDEVQVVHVLPSARSFVPALPPNRVHPLHATWNVHSQLLLAFADEETQRRMLAHQQNPLTAHTVVSPESVRARLAQVRSDAVAYDHEEIYLGTCAVGVPVMWKGKAVAALALIVPVERFTAEAVPSFVARLRPMAADMGRRLGAHG